MKSINLLNPYVWAWFVITIVEYLWLDSVSKQPVDFNTVSWIITFNLLGQLFTLSQKKEPMVSFFTAFIVFYYVFHFGQVVLLGLFPKYEYDYMNYVTSYMTNETILHETLKLCIICINMFFIGGLILRYKANDEYSGKVILNAKNIGKITFFIFFPFRLLFDGILIVSSAMGGYMAAQSINTVIPGVFAALAALWYATIPLYYIELKSNKEKKRFLIIILLYLLLSMISGMRGLQMVCIVSLFIIVLSEQKKLKKKQIILYGIIGVLGMYFIDILYDLRNVGLNAFLKDYSSAFEDSRNTNIVLETLGTFGETVYTPYLVVEGYNSSFHPFFGECFIKSIGAVIPDVTGVFKDFNNDAYFARRLGTENAIGGSFAGEMYYNFGSLYWLASLLIGMLFIYVSNKISIEMKKGNYYQLLLLIPFAVLFIWWVRDTVGDFTRKIVWMAIIIYYLKSKKLVILNRFRLI